MSSGKAYMVIAVLKKDRTAHVYGPFSWDEAATVQLTLMEGALPELESCSVLSVIEERTGEC